MSTVNPNIKPKGIYELRGGIERYINTFPQGGYWKGKNYLFDRRQEQVPADKPQEQVEAEVDSRCCVCRQKWTVYRGKFKCSQSLCGVPVIVCEACREQAANEPHTLTCELCKEGYKAPRAMPDLVGLKRKAEQVVSAKKVSSNDDSAKKRKHSAADAAASGKICANRLFLTRLPLTITKSRLVEWLGDVKTFHWLTDKDSGAFYGSCMIEFASKEAADSILDKAIPKFDKKKPRVAVAQERAGQIWPPPTVNDSEFPPIGR